MIENSFAKSGETMVQLSLLRNSKGIKVTVKAHKKIEDFFKEAAGGEQVKVSEFGREWISADGKALLAHWTAEAVANKSAAVPYSAGEIGRPLTRQDGHGRETKNISFLRLKGISEGEGTTFYIRGVYTLGYVQKLSQELCDACKYFYIDYLKPVDFTVSVVSQETRL